MEVLTTFDPGRAMLEDYLDRSLYPARLMVDETYSLAESLASGQLALDSRLLVFEHEQILYAFPMTVVLSYNVIQGQIGEQQWMMTFCNACNTGMVFNPVIEGKLLLTSVLTPEQEKLSRMMEKMRANPEKVEAGIASTIGQEDTRRPRFELGLGVWNLSGSIFFPLTMLYADDRVLRTTFDNRPLLIYQLPEAVAPVAAFIETQRAVWEGEVLRLDKGAYIQNDILFTANGEQQPLERPMQLLMRWYGFALTFPGCGLPTL